MFARVGLQRLFPAFPVVESVTVTAYTGTPASFAVNMPSTRPDNDLYICVVSSEQTTPNEFGSVDAGWTQLETTYNSIYQYDPMQTAYWWVGSSEPATYTVNLSSHSAGHGIIYRISGQHGSPIDASAASTVSSNGTFDSESVTTTVTPTLVLTVSIAEQEITAVPFIEDTKGGASPYYGASHSNVRAIGATPVGESITASSTSASTMTIAIKGP